MTLLQIEPGDDDDAALDSELRACLAKSRGNVVMAAYAWDRKVANKQRWRISCWLRLLRQTKAQVELELDQQNDGDAGLSIGAGDGQATFAGSPSPQGDAEGHVALASDGQFANAPASPTTKREEEGQPTGADDVGQTKLVLPSQPPGDEAGQSSLASDGHGGCARSSPPDRDGVGHCSLVGDDHTSSAHPAREPTPIETKVKGDVKTKLYADIWGKWERRHHVDLKRTRLSELLGMRDLSFEQAFVYEEIIRNHPHDSPDAFIAADDPKLGLKRVVTEAEFQEYVKHAERKTAKRRSA